MVIQDVLGVWGVWIFTYTVLSIRTDLKASIADALEASFCVDAAAVATHDAVDDTLVNIWTLKKDVHVLLHACASGSF